jgi:hypothetical protein
MAELQPLPKIGGAHVRVPARTMKMSEREEAKKALRTMIMTALNNCSEEVKANPMKARQIMTDAILDQITQPQVAWALKEISKDVKKY